MSRSMRLTFRLVDYGLPASLFLIVGFPDCPTDGPKQPIAYVYLASLDAARRYLVIVLRPLGSVIAYGVAPKINRG